MAKLKHAQAMICVASLLCGSLVYSAPAINQATGGWSHDGTITISGTGFGTKPSATPVLWDTVDNATSYSSLVDGDAIPIGGSNPWKSIYANSSGRDDVKYETSSTEQCGVSAAMYKATSKKTAYLDGLSWTKTDSVYVSWWWKQDTDTSAGDHSSKWIRVSDNSDETGKTFSWTQHQSIIYTTTSGYCANQWRGWSGNPGKWNFMEVWFDNAAQRYSIRINGVALYNNISWSPCSSLQMNELWKLGFDGGGNNPPAITWWMDDIYVDSSFARVMLGNASSYSSSTQFEMQSLVSWSSSSIDITVNQGGFNSGATSYLYVIDSQEVVNQTGYPVVISSTVSQASPPNPPANLTVTY
ncbi:MAG: hypothetical protein V3T17_02920 [Pseudomonadales bacterium]